MNQELNNVRNKPLSQLGILLCIGMLGVVFVFQRLDVLNLVCHCSINRSVHFVVNKAVRLLFNDLAMLALIHLWFRSKSITRFALYIQLFDMLVLLPVYLVVKLSVEGPSEISSPLLSQFHRLIVNPTLMILIFPAVYFQRALK